MQYSEIDYNVSKEKGDWWITSPIHEMHGSKPKAKLVPQKIGYEDFVIIPISAGNVKVTNESAIKAADDYKCSPPPWFILTLSFLQVLFYMHYSILEEFGAKRDLLERLLVYKPDLTFHAWRYALYSLFHIGWLHLIFNVCVQLSVGIPLELLHGPVRVGLVYCAGVIAGAVSTNCVNNSVVLLGSSGGVYALLAAHLSDLILNYSQMELGCLKLLAVTCIALLDILLALKDEYGTVHEESSAVSYIAHISGASTGLVVALAVLKSYNSKPRTVLIQKLCFWLLALLLFLMCMYITFVKVMSNFVSSV